MTSNFLHWQRIKGLFITENWDVPGFPFSLLLTSHFLLLLMKVSTPLLSHTGSNFPCDTTEGVLITKERSENRFEMSSWSYVWCGRRVSQSGSPTKQMPSHITALSPGPPALSAPCSCPLLSPCCAEGQGNCCAVLWWGEMITFWNVLSSQFLIVLTWQNPQP